MKQVDFDRDITPFLPVMVGAYEKANIHAPYRDEEEASEVLSDELEEAYDALDVIDRLIFDEDCNFNILEQVDLKVIEAHAMSTICELLQVVAVCKKYGQLLEREDGNR